MDTHLWISDNVALLCIGGWILGAVVVVLFNYGAHKMPSPPPDGVYENPVFGFWDNEEDDAYNE
jgi:hypothetical protein